jgi:hypothetical protein
MLSTKMMMFVCSERIESFYNTRIHHEMKYGYKEKDNNLKQILYIFSFASKFYLNIKR